jgi:hypothetical protein
MRRSKVLILPLQLVFPGITAAALLRLSTKLNNNPVSIFQNYFLSLALWQNKLERLPLTNIFLSSAPYPNMEVPHLYLQMVD